MVQFCCSGVTGAIMARIGSWVLCGAFIGPMIGLCAP
jgi:hypothetical protein